ncbi:MAG TPA: hypothetical protein VNB22_00735 [Pyrinomonadaceae bacterium]|jgi:hypothetical protein|nr:hypothetical protein [Pyrinomonadaceae bacterium]
MKYTAEILGELNSTSALKYGRRIGVFKLEDEKKELIGEYERNYLSFFDTFFHFQKNGKDFALYSPDYTVTRIMELPSCRDIGGEEAHSYGFCPVDYFVPALKTGEHYPFGFVAGCVWGDDSTYKIQYLDLSEAEKGIVKRDDRFGSIVLPENQSLKDAIDMYDYGWDEEDESANYIRISVLQTFDLTTGKKIE